MLSRLKRGWADLRLALEALPPWGSGGRLEAPSACRVIRRSESCNVRRRQCRSRAWKRRGQRRRSSGLSQPSDRPRLPSVSATSDAVLHHGGWLWGQDQDHWVVWCGASRCIIRVTGVDRCFLLEEARARDCRCNQASWTPGKAQPWAVWKARPAKIDSGEGDNMTRAGTWGDIPMGRWEESY